MNTDQKFVKMLGDNINGWTYNYYEALPFVAELVIAGKVNLTPETDLDKLGDDLAKQYGNYDGDTFSSLLTFFVSLSKPLTMEALDELGIQIDDLWNIGLNRQDLEDLFLNNPRRSAELTLKAQKQFQPVYNQIGER